MPDPPDDTSPTAVEEEQPAGSDDAKEDAPPAEVAGVGEVRDPWYRALLVPALAVLTALTIGAIIIIFSNSEALSAWSTFFADPLGALRASGKAVADAYSAMFAGGLGSPRQIVSAISSGSFSEVQRSLIPLSETVVTATPLILAGLSVALGFRAGLFNIGAEGQITAGAMLAAIVGFSFTGLPGPLHLGLMIAAGFVGGAVWGAIPGFLKARTGAHEVITTIMLNFVALRLADYALSTKFFLPPDSNAPIAKPVTVAYPHLLGSGLRVHAGIFVAVGLAVAVAWLLNRSTLGFEFRAVGSNPDAARTAGMRPSRTYVVVMALAGGLAGLAGANQLASATPSLATGFSSGFGFDAIALALLGRARPAGVVAAAFLFAVLRVGGRNMQVLTQTPPEIVTVIEALVLLFVAAPALVRAIYRVRARRVAGAEAFTKGWSG